MAASITAKNKKQKTLSINNVNHIYISSSENESILSSPCSPENSSISDEIIAPLDSSKNFSEL